MSPHLSPPKTFARPSLGLALLAAIALLAAGQTAPGSVLAQEPPDQLVRKVVGPYEVTVSSSPPSPVEGLGGPRISVGVVTYPSAEPVTDAEVRIAMQRPDRTEAGEVTLNQNPIAPQFYEARVTLQEVGVWTWTVAIESPLGLELVDGMIAVQPGPSSGLAGTVAWFIVIGVLLGGGLLAWLALRPKKRPQE